MDLQTKGLLGQIAAGFSARGEARAAAAIQRLIDREDQDSISSWDGPGAFNTVTTGVGRMMLEVGELLEAIGWSASARETSLIGDRLIYQRSDIEDNTEALAAEMADVAIVLMRVASAGEIDLQEAIDAKMAINRSREWERRPDGSGRHLSQVGDETSPSE